MDDQSLDDEKLELIDRPASAAPTSGSWWRDFLFGLAAWARHTFSIGSLLNGLKALAWVAPLSAIIWIYAEREQTATTGVTLAVVVRSPDPTRVVRLVDPFDGKVRVDMSGPNGRLGFVRDSLESGAKQVQVDVPDAALLRPGRHEIPASLVNNVEPFVSNGLTLSNFSPRELSIDVDMIVEEDAEIVASQMQNLAAPPVFEPRTVRVRAPHSVLEAAQAEQPDGKLRVVANLAGTREALTPGSHDLTGVPVTLANQGKQITITPSTVSAHVEIRKSDVEITLPAIPVWVLYPPGLEDKYKAVYDPSLANVHLIGPEEQINALQSPASTFKPKATFEVAPGIPVDTERQAALQFQLPSGVRVSPEDASRRITFHLVERRPPE